jgi:hypothetical protein
MIHEPDWKILTEIQRYDNAVNEYRRAHNVITKAPFRSEGRYYVSLSVYRFTVALVRVTFASGS